jgi:hypothetical protein
MSARFSKRAQRVQALLPITFLLGSAYVPRQAFVETNLTSPPSASERWSARGENHKRFPTSFITYFNDPIISRFRKIHTHSMQHFHCMQIGGPEPFKLHPFCVPGSIVAPNKVKEVAWHFRPSLACC